MSQQFFKPPLPAREPTRIIRHGSNNTIIFTAGPHDHVTSNTSNVTPPIAQAMNLVKQPSTFARAVSSGGSIGQKEHIMPISVRRAMLIPSNGSVKALTPEVVSSAFRKTGQMSFANAVAARKMEIQLPSFSQTSNVLKNFANAKVGQT